jgi:hypothetical protein
VKDPALERSVLSFIITSRSLPRSRVLRAVYNLHMTSFLGHSKRTKGVALILLILAIVTLLRLVSELKFRPERAWRRAGAHDDVVALNLGDNVCEEATHLFERESLIRANKQARLFHVFGGNLHSIQSYLDAQIDPTLVKLGVTFTPEGNKFPLPAGSVASFLNRHNVEPKYSHRGGYGRKLPGKFEPAGKLWEHRFVDVKEPWSRERWDAALGPSAQCNNLVQLGSGYEKKFMCVDAGGHKYGETSAVENHPCKIWSIGSNDEWGFEIDVLKRTKCTVDTFDCTLRAPSHKPNDHRIRFHPLCIGADSRTVAGREYRSFDQLMDVLGLASPPTLLKMDIEGFEYNTLTAMLSNSTKGLPQQLMIEIHWASKMVDLTWLLRTRQSAELALFTGMLFNAGGYMPVHTSWDKGCVPCLEVLFVRVKC